jgi:exodeoxyribonuclease-3|tara:strand:+ start:1500 stop:2282 length:783 start_codon:yes stop_codon:yes gene_type:complete
LALNNKLIKILSYNINGIRAALRKNLLEWLKDYNPDIVCFQEIKANEDQFDKSKFTDLGYHSYWFSAQKKGYSGVGIITKMKPLNVEYGTGIDYMDFEGRNLRIDFKNFSVMSLYLPSGTNINRLAFKFQYMDDFKAYINNLTSNVPNLIIGGDFNICHKAIDIHDPIRNAKVSGFLPKERDWIDNFINDGFVDSFRIFNNKPHKYSWWSYRANSRNNNKGWRIDYLLAAEKLKKNISESYILDDVVHSDHCPIGLNLKI